MAHFLIYKRPAEITPYTVDFSDLVASNDTGLSSTASTVKVFDSEGIDRTTTTLSSTAYSGSTVTAKLVQGLDGEDYLVYFDGVGNTSGNKYSRILELRVRSKLSGNL